MGSLLVVTGPPGAGKSTISSLLAARFEPSVLVDGDAFFAFVRGGAIDPWLPLAHEQNTVVTNAAASAAGQFASGGYTTIYDGVIGPWFLPTFRAAAGIDTLDYVILLPDVEQCVARMHHRGDHGFRDEDAARHMHDAFTKSSIAPRHVLNDPPNDPVDVTQLVLAARAAGQLAYPG